MKDQLASYCFKIAISELVCAMIHQEIQCGHQLGRWLSMNVSNLVILHGRSVLYLAMNKCVSISSHHGIMQSLSSITVISNHLLQKIKNQMKRPVLAWQYSKMKSVVIGNR